MHYEKNTLISRAFHQGLQTPNSHGKKIGIFESSPQGHAPATQLMLNLDVFLASNGPCTNWLKMYSSTTWEDVVQDSYQKTQDTLCQKACAWVLPRADLNSWKGGKQIIGQFPGWIEVLRQLAMSGHFRVIPCSSRVTSLQFTRISEKTYWFLGNLPRQLGGRIKHRLISVIWAKRLFRKKIDRVFKSWQRPFLAKWGLKSHPLKWWKSAGLREQCHHQSKPCEWRASVKGLTLSVCKLCDVIKRNQLMKITYIIHPSQFSKL